MASLNQARAAAVKAAREAHNIITAAGDAVTDEQIKAAEDAVNEVKALDERIGRVKSASEVIGALSGTDVGEEPAPRVKGGIGEQFVAAMKAAGRSLKDPGTFQMEVKAATDVQVTGGNAGAFGPLLTDIDRNFVMPKRERLVVADLMGSGTVSGTAISYPVFGALEGGTGFVGEAATKPRLHVGDPTWVTDALSEVAGWFTISDDMAEDLPYVVSEIQSTALYDLQAKEEAALLGGDGTAPNLRGLLNRSGIQVHAKGDDSVADAIFKASTLVARATDFAADALVINPADYEALRLSKDSNGQYYGGGFFQGAYGNGAVLTNPGPWGLRTVVTNAAKVGEPIVGAFKSAKVFRKGALRVESTNSHGEDFINDRVTIRVRERLGLQVRYPAAFVKVSLSA